MLLVSPPSELNEGNHAARVSYPLNRIFAQEGSVKVLLSDGDFKYGRQEQVERNYAVVVPAGLSEGQSFRWSSRLDA